MDVSIWEEEVLPNKTAITTATKRHYDFIIAGAGLAGLWTAFEIKKQAPKATVLLLEKGTIPTGASTRNAGFACFGSPTELLYDKEHMGENSMWELVAMRHQGIQKIREVLSDTVISFDACGGYECFSENETIEKVNAHLDYLNGGMKTITGSAVFHWRNDLEAFGFAGFKAMIENKQEGGLHSGKMVNALWQMLLGQHVEIVYQTEVKSWQQVNGKVEVLTNQQAFLASQLILATNAFLTKIFPGTSVVPARGQVLLTAPIEGLAMRGTFHYQEGYYYFRNLGNRILLGGARNHSFATEETDEMVTTPVIQEQLALFLHQHILPGRKVPITHRWSGIMAFTPGKIPLIQQLDRNVISMTACNGMGVALTPVMAEKLVKQLSV